MSICMSQWVYVWANEYMCKWMSICVSEWVYVQVNEYMYESMSMWVSDCGIDYVSECVGKRAIVWVNEYDCEWISEQASENVSEWECETGSVCNMLVVSTVTHGNTWVYCCYRYLNGVLLHQVCIIYVRGRVDLDEIGSPAGASGVFLCVFGNWTSQWLLIELLFWQFLDDMSRKCDDCSFTGLVLVKATST